MHPLLIAVMITDFIAVLLILAAAREAGRVVLGWAPAEASRKQLKLERAVERASLEGRAAFILLSLSSLGVVLAITAVLPAIVPGAMCGTGVLVATEGQGGRALGMRILALLALGVWRLLDRLDRREAEAPLAAGAARALLVATPLAVLAALDTSSAFLKLDTQESVECCSAVYDQLRMLGHDAPNLAPLRSAFAGLSLAVVALSAALWRLPGSKMLRLGLAGAAIPWVLIATRELILDISAYHYGVLNHHCPWCLFLPEHGNIGYLLFGALALVMVRSIRAVVFGAAAERVPALFEFTKQGIRRSARWVFVASIVFLVFALGPVARWRMDNGVWIDSSRGHPHRPHAVPQVDLQAEREARG